MERAAWTEERLDDLAEGMRSGFARVEQDMRAGFDRVDKDIRELRLLILTFGGGIILALIGAVGAFLANGS